MKKGEILDPEFRLYKSSARGCLGLVRHKYTNSYVAQSNPFRPLVDDLGTRLTTFVQPFSPRSEAQFIGSCCHSLRRQNWH